MMGVSMLLRIRGIIIGVQDREEGLGIIREPGQDSRIVQTHKTKRTRKTSLSNVVFPLVLRLESLGGIRPALTVLVYRQAHAT